MSPDTTSTRSDWPIPRSAAAAVIAAAVAIGIGLLIASSATAQEGDGGYTSTEAGQLTFVASGLVPGAEVTISGSGFAADAVLDFFVQGDDPPTTVLSEKLRSDGQGAVTHAFVLPDEMISGEYLTRVSGLTTDGGLLWLDSRVEIVGNVTVLTTTPVATPTTVAAPDQGIAVPDGPESGQGVGPDAGQGTGVSADPGAANSESSSAERQSGGEASTSSGPLPTVDSSDGDGATLSVSGSEFASGDTPFSASNDGPTLVWIIVALLVGALGTAGYAVRRRATQPY